MCDRESFAKIRDAIADLQKADAVQSEQIKTLFNTTKEQGDTQKAIVNRLLLVVVIVLIIAVLALVFGALGKDGFNGVTKAVPGLVTQAAER